MSLPEAAVRRGPRVLGLGDVGERAPLRWQVWDESVSPTSGRGRTMVAVVSVHVEMGDSEPGAMEEVGLLT